MMIHSLEELCGTLSIRELRSAINAYWRPQAPNLPTKINYTFNLASAFTSLTDSVEFTSDESQVMATSQSLQDSIQSILDSWETACADSIQFNQVPQLTDDGKGIVFAACDEMANNVHGLATFHRTTSLENHIEFEQVLVCLPSLVNDDFDLLTISHEVGHALGFKHLHEIPSVKERLMKTLQGRGCSVMPYPDLISSPINACNTSQYCLEQDYAVFPGPADAAMCQALYQTKDYTPIVPKGNFLIFLYGLLNGAGENTVYSYIAGLHHDEQSLFSPSTAKNTATLLTTYLRYQYSIGNQPLNLSFSLLSILANTFDSQYYEKIELCRILLTIVGLGVTIYTSFDEQWQTLLLMTAAGILCDTIARPLGSMMGENLACLSNSLIDYSSSMLSSASNCLSSTFKYRLSFWRKPEEDVEVQSPVFKKSSTISI